MYIKGMHYPIMNITNIWLGRYISKCINCFPNILVLNGTYLYLREKIIET